MQAEQADTEQQTSDCTQQEEGRLSAVSKTCRWRIHRHAAIGVWYRPRNVSPSDRIGVDTSLFRRFNRRLSVQRSVTSMRVEIVFERD